MELKNFLLKDARLAYASSDGAVPSVRGRDGTRYRHTTSRAAELKREFVLYKHLNRRDKSAFSSSQDVFQEQQLPVKELRPKVARRLTFRCPRAVFNVFFISRQFITIGDLGLRMSTVHGGAGHSSLRASVCCVVSFGACFFIEHCIQANAVHFMLH